MLCIALGLAASFACTASRDDGTAQPTIRVAYSGPLDFGDIPSALAHERLRAQGYQVEETYYSGPDLAVQALSMGAAEFANGALTTAWVAAARGAPIRTVMEQVANPHRLVATSAVSSCADLDGRQLALHGESAVGTVLLRAYLAEECPAARPTVLFVADSPNRAASLLAGGVDAAVIELATFDWLESQAPGRFHVVSDFAARWPSIKTTGVQVNTAFAAAHRDTVLDYVRARLAANREVLADVDLLAERAELALGPSDRWKQVARAHVDARTWPPDGGLTADDIGRSLAFFANETLAPAAAESVADVTFLQEALTAP
jgi:ABC-type nitrate/sulfonate/bicarbonate transport system substrate-binding protein